MQRRALHLASLFLLLASLGTAEAASLREGSAGFAAPYVRVLMAQQEAAVRQALQGGVDAALEPGVAADAQARDRKVWGMRAPSAQALRVQATSSGL